MHRLRVTADKSAYDVVVGRGAWRALRRFPVARYSRVFVLTERALWNRWGKQFLRESGLKRVQWVFLPPGETSKTLKMVEHVASELLEGGADRHALLIAFGGGVIGDVGGFVASTYMRGIDCVQAPTTVVAQVDSAVGGKTAIEPPVPSAIASRWRARRTFTAPSSPVPVCFVRISPDESRQRMRGSVPGEKPFRPPW